MISKSLRALVAAAIAVGLGTSTARAGDDTIAAARDLYASAAYEDALAVLNRLRSTGQSGADAEAVEQYRAFCLLALGRSTEAQDAIAAVVTAEPSYHPSDTDVSPRIRTAFSDVRRRMLPAIIQQKYADAKGAFERKDWARAADGFAQVLNALADPDVAPVAGQPPLSDLRVLATGFHELSAAAVTPPPPPPAPAAPAPVATTPAPAPVQININKIYDGTERNVVPPTTMRQQLPSFPGRIIGPMHGAMEVIIDQSGQVESAKMRVSVNAFYDTLAVAATKAWRYQPATFEGTPVRFRKIIQISLNPS